MNLSRTIQTFFRATDAAEVDMVYKRIAEALGVSATTVTEDGLTGTGQLTGGPVILSIGPAEEIAEARNGVWSLTATRVYDGADNDWSSLLDLVRRIPLTETEIDDICRSMPLTSTLPNALVGRPLAGLSAIFTIHHMRDFVIMIKAAIELGLDPASITVIDKEYKYEMSGRVDQTLIDLGITVERYSDLSGALGRHIQRGRCVGRRSIILDDGGYVFPVLCEHFRADLQDFVGLIEQTTSGIWKLRPYAEIPVPVFSVAESQLKATIESYGVADAAFSNVRRLIPDEMWEGRPAVVLGLGNIGKELADILRDRHVRVTVYDRDIVKLLAAHCRGFDTERDLPEILRSRRPVTIFGCTGGDPSHSMTMEHFEALRRDCYLVSLTSRDFEFDLGTLRSIAEESWCRGRLGTSYRLPNGVVVTAIADGLPVNFHHAESMPDRYSDLILASMLIGACTLADPECDFLPGHNVSRTNNALLASGVVDRYYDLYH